MKSSPLRIRSKSERRESAVKTKNSKSGRRTGLRGKVVFANFVRLISSLLRWQLIPKSPTKLTWLRLLDSTYLWSVQRTAKIAGIWSKRSEKCSSFKCCLRKRTKKSIVLPTSTRCVRSVSSAPKRCLRRIRRASLNSLRRSKMRQVKPLPSLRRQRRIVMTRLRHSVQSMISARLYRAKSTRNWSKWPLITPTKCSSMICGPRMWKTKIKLARPSSWKISVS